MESNQDALDCGLSVLDFPVGAHVCLIYENEEERRDLVAKFVKAGLGGAQRVLYFTDVMTPIQLFDWLTDLGVEVPDGPMAQPFRVSDAESVYCPDGFFDPQHMFAYWDRAYREAAAEGFHGVRATGETSWAVRGIPGSERLIEYEALLNKTIEGRPITALCQYDVNLFDGGTILDVLRVHPMIISRGQLVQNPLYVGPDEFFAGRQGRG